MSKIACINNSVVVNIVEATLDFAASLGYDIVIELNGAPVHIGTEYIEGAFVIEPTPLPNFIDPCLYLIDIGPFFDRFGDKKIPILANPDIVIKAIIMDVSVRKWVDLQNPKVAQALSILVAKSAITEAEKIAILTTPVARIDNAALRKDYFNGI